MLESNYTLGTTVYNADNQKLGTIDRVVIDPKTNEVTHLVVHKGFLFTVDKVIPVGLIRETTDEAVILKESVTDFDALPDFEEVHYVEAGDMESKATDNANRKVLYWYPPLVSLGAFPLAPTFYSTPVPPVEVIKERNIPYGTVALKKNATVISKDGDLLGKIARVYVNPDTDEVEFFLISQEEQEKRLVPAWWVDVSSDEEVHLVLNSSVLKRLPVQEPQK